MGRTDAAGQVSPRGCHPHRALRPMTIDHLSCPSQLSCWGTGDPPPHRVPQLQVSHQPKSICFSASLFIAPSSVSGWPPWCHVIRREWRGQRSQQEGVSFARVQAPFPGRSSPASEDSPTAANLWRKSAGMGIFLFQNLAAKRQPPHGIHFLVVLGFSSILHARDMACTGPCRV